MSISDSITINAGEAISQLNAFAEAAARAEAALAKLNAGGPAGAGADKLAASMDKAAASIEAAAQRASAAMGRLSSASRSATGGLDSLGASADTAAGGLDRAAAGADASAAAMDRQAAAAGRAGKVTREAAAGHETFWKGVKVLAVGGAVAAVYGIDKAMKLQSEVTRLYTAAGLKGVRPGDVTAATLAIGSKTGFTGQTIAEAMYHPVSAGLDWKTSKLLTEQSANLANIHGANLDDTTYALSSVMKAYNIGAKQVTPTAAQLNAIVGQGDMRFQDFNESIKNWAPTAASMGISMQSLGAGLAYLTDRGNSAEVASTRLTMGLSMATAGSKAANVYLKDLGLTTGHLELRNKSLQKTMEDGGLTTNKFAADLKKPDGLYVALNDMQAAFRKAGLSASQSDQVMAKIFGGGRSDKAIVSLMQNLDGVKQKYDDIGHAVHGYGKAVTTEQATAQQKWKDFTASAQNLATGLGMRMLPAFTKIAGGAANLLQGPGGGVTAGLLGGAAALFAGNKLVSGAGAAFRTGEAGLRGVGKVAEVLKIPGLDKLAGIGKAGGAAALDGSAARLTAAAGSLEGAAASLKEGGIAGGASGAGGKGAAAAEGAAAGRFAGLRAAAGAAGEGVGIGLILRAVGDSLSPKGTTAGRVNEALQKQAAQAPSTLHPYFAGGLEAKAATSGIGLEIGKIIGAVFSQRATAAPPAMRESGQSPAFTGRFGPATAPQPVTPKIQPPPTGQLTAATAQIAHAMARDLGKPVKVAAPDMSGLAGAKGKAQAAATGITQALGQALHKPVKAAPPDLSAMTAAAVKARAAGASVSSGFASGIEAGKGAAVAAAADVANAAAAAMAHAVQSRSPSRVTHKIGSDTAKGFEIGLEGGKDAVKAAADALGKSATKAADITSIDNTTKKLLADVKGDSGLTKMLRADQSRLTGLARQRSRLEQEITNAQDIAKNAISAANITGAADYQPVLASAGGPLSSFATITGMQGMAADQKQFASVVASLKKQGLNATSLSQIVQAGPSALPMALGLSQGGKGAIGQVNALEQQIHASAAKLGSTAAGPMFQAGVDAAKGLASGIKSQLGSVEAAIKQLAQHMVSAVKSALKSHSPSLVFAEIGAGIPAGLAMGVDQGAGTAMSAVSRMGGRLATAPFHVPAGYGHPAAGGHFGGGHGGGGVTNVTVHLTVNGSLVHQQDVASHLQDALLTRGLSNWNSGLVLPGRAVG